ncbi:MAG: hypothetical protein J5741_02090, partial [Bacteroidales bacterium]|nr:hypothetical protein [Bacteroidales bacterium]
LTLNADDRATVYLKTAEDKWDTLLHYDKSASANPKAQTTLKLHKDEFIHFKIDYHEEDLEANISLKWSKDGGEATPVPGVWKGFVNWNRTTRCFTTKDDDLFIIEFNKPDRTEPLVIENMPKIKPYSKMILLGTPKGELKWKQDKHGTLTIDFSHVNQKLIDAVEHAWVIMVCNYK